MSYMEGQLEGLDGTSVPGVYYTNDVAGVVQQDPNAVTGYGGSFFNATDAVDTQNEPFEFRSLKYDTVHDQFMPFQFKQIDVSLEDIVFDGILLVVGVAIGALDVGGMRSFDIQWAR